MMIVCAIWWRSRDAGIEHNIIIIFFLLATLSYLSLLLLVYAVRLSMSLLFYYYFSFCDSAVGRLAGWLVAGVCAALVCASLHLCVDRFAC